MKKILITLSIFTLTLSSAQDSILRNKSGISILPEKGDFAIGVNASGLLSTSIFNYYINSDNVIMPISSLIYSKYFLSSRYALRLKLNVMNRSRQVSSNVPITSLQNNFVTDKMEYKSFSETAWLGIEKRGGHNRLQYFVGLDVGFSMNNITKTYKYGNLLMASNNMYTPVFTTTFYDNFSTTYSLSGNRVLEEKIRSGLMLSGKLTLGGEYFIAPKLSLGAEVSFVYSQINKLTKTTENEYINLDNNTSTYSIQKQKIESSQGESLFYTDYANGLLYLIFHF